MTWNRMFSLNSAPVFGPLLLMVLGVGWSPLWASQDDWNTAPDRTVVRVAHDGAIDPIDKGKWKLRGTLEVRFEGPIAPHEASFLEVVGGGCEGLQGTFDEIQLPEGWLYDIGYDYSTRKVTLSKLRPNHAPAFPGAEGFGKYTQGGRGGKVYTVTNLNDDGPGSFREACEAEGPRTVLFQVSGTIPLERKLKISNPNITIAGQSAPGDGICVKNYQVSFETDEVIIRYMRFRPGDERREEQDAFGGKGNQIVIDHCSVSWGVDETLSINQATNLSVQWCLVSESLTKSVHKKGSHGYGGLWGGPGGSFHHNILAHHTSRNPRASGNANSGLLDFRNNVIYNWGFNSAYGGELWPRNWIGNYYKYGPATDRNVRHRIFIQSNPRGKMYADGNFVWEHPEVTADNWEKGIDFDEEGEASQATLRVDRPFVVAPVDTQPAEEAFERVLAEAGASHSRDSVDRRIIQEIRTGTATYGKTYKGGGKGIIDSQADVGGWPEIQSLPARPDQDIDGMPDDWEKRYGLLPNNPHDSGSDPDNDGYTNLEEWLNGTNPVEVT